MILRVANWATEYVAPSSMTWLRVVYWDVGIFLAASAENAAVRLSLEAPFYDENVVKR